MSRATGRCAPNPIQSRAYPKTLLLNRFLVHGGLNGPAIVTLSEAKGLCLAWPRFLASLGMTNRRDILAALC
jgi:hypothetical protein